MRNATKFWPAASACPGTNSVTAPGTSDTCDGNGDGWVFTTSSSKEPFRGWQHLANAGLIEGSYSGVGGGDDIDAVPAVNVPRSKMSEGLWIMHYGGNFTGDSTAIAGRYGHYLVIGGAIDGTYPLKSEEAYNIDMKLDDGKPATGQVWARNWNTGTTSGCFQAANMMDTTGAYNLTVTSKVCSLMFLNAF